LIQPEIIYNMLRECACTHGTLGKHHTTSSYMKVELEIDWMDCSRWTWMSISICGFMP